jgi:hypothetical protein
MKIKGAVFFFLTMLIIFFASAIIINPLYFAFQFFFLIPREKSSLQRKPIQLKHITQFRRQEVPQ